MTETGGDTEFEIPSVNRVRCEECGEHFEKVAQHWSHLPSHRPSLTEEQRRLVAAEVRHGQTQVESDRVNPYVEVYSTERDDLTDLDEALGILSMGVERSVPVVARRLGITVGEGEDIFRLRTRSHPAFEQWADVGDSVDQQSKIGEWVGGEGGSEPTEGDVFSIPEPQSPLTRIRDRLQGWSEGREQLTSVTISLSTDEAEAREVFSDAPVEPRIVEHDGGVDVSLDGNEVSQWVA